MNHGTVAVPNVHVGCPDFTLHNSKFIYTANYYEQYKEKKIHLEKEVWRLV